MHHPGQARSYREHRSAKSFAEERAISGDTLRSLSSADTKATITAQEMKDHNRLSLIEQRLIKEEETTKEIVGDMAKRSTILSATMSQLLDQLEKLWDLLE